MNGRSPTRRVAIVGAGVSGLGAAIALDGHADIVLFEAEDRLGGHAWTVNLARPGRTDLECDIGFIVHNRRNYPLLCGMFDHLGIATRASRMSFSVATPSRCLWSSRSLPGYLRRPEIWPLVAEILAFNRKARADLAAERFAQSSLEDWLQRAGVSERLRRDYLLPLTSAVWSSSAASELQRPAAPLFRFLHNHRLLHVFRPRWRTVRGGSRRYVEAIAGLLGQRAHRRSPVRRIERAVGGRLNVVADGDSALFDAVVIACHADQALSLLRAGGFARRCEQLSRVHFQANDAILHSDVSVMPPARWQWASWNVHNPGTEDEPAAERRQVHVTYWLNLLQGLPSDPDLFLTLNAPDGAIDAGAIRGRYRFAHPVADFPSHAAVEALRRMQGEDGLWLAGAWMGNGFHEDGLHSGIEAARALGGGAPWRTA